MLFLNTITCLLWYPGLTVEGSTLKWFVSGVRVKLCHELELAKSTPRPADNYISVVRVTRDTIALSSSSHY